MTAIQAALNDLLCGDQIRSRPCPACYLCGTTGEPLYKNLNDRLYGAPGTWNLKRCPEPGCGLLWLDPMPAEGDIDKAYKDYFTHIEVSDGRKGALKRAYGLVKKGYWALKYGYGEDSIGRWQKILGMMINLHPGRSAELDFSVMYLQFQRNGQLLDIGCGNGQALQCMAELGWQVQGVDFDPRAVQIARKKGLEVGLGSLEHQAFPSDSFDAITMSHLIEHVHDPLELLKECRRILKPGGRLALVTPNINSAGHRIYGSSWFHLDPPRHLRIFNVGSLTTLLQRASFHSAEIWTTIRDANRAYIASRSVQGTGRYEMGSRQPRSVRFWGKAMQTIEWARLKIDVQAGEEIAAIAQK